MNRQRVYLAGAVTGMSDSDMSRWRQYVTERLAAEFEVVDPTRYDYRGKEALHAEEIVCRNIEDIDSCHWVLLNAAVPSWGSAMEAIVGWERGKGVLIVCPMEPISPWLYVHSTKIVRSLDDAVEYLRSEPNI